MSLLKQIDWEQIDLELPGSIPVAAVLVVRSLDGYGDFQTSIIHDQADQTLRLGMLHEALLAIAEEAQGAWRHEPDEDE